MSKLSELLQERMRGEQSKKSKIIDLVHRAQQTPSPFGTYTLTDQEKNVLKTLLERFKKSHKSDIEGDFQSLIHITQEVRAINNQAALLHGERIQKAQTILKSYQEGAFTAWLLETYGNRQTPYNLLQYYEFYYQMPSHLRPLIDQMPRQAIYTLASRSIPFAQKKAFIESYQGQTKEELLRQIRRQFPLDQEDRRAEDSAAFFLKGMEKMARFLKASSVRFTKEQKKQLAFLLEEINECI